jgi:hypothetical protein
MAEGDAAASSSAFLKQKIGPLPAGAWLGLVGSAAVVWYWYKNRTASSSSANSAAAQAAADQAAASEDAAGAFYGTGSNTGTGTTTTTTTGATYADNFAWQTAAVNFLVAQGYDATLANTAISNWLGSDTLTTQEQALVNLAIAQLGEPPTPPVAGGSTTSVSGPGAGGTTTVTALQAGQVVEVPVALENGQTWATVAKKAGESVQHLEENNPGASGAPNTVIEVPILVRPSGADATWQGIAAEWGISPGHLEENNPTIDQG